MSSCEEEVELFRIKVVGRRGKTGATGSTGGIGATGPTGIPTIVSVGRTIFVDSVFGNDATAEFQNFIKPARTVTAAYAIAAAFAVPGNPVQVFVRAGTYDEPNPIFLSNAVTLTGSGRSSTLIRGQFNGNNITGVSNVSDLTLVSINRAAIIHPGTGVLVLRRVQFTISNNRFGFNQSRGILNLFDISVDYTNDNYNFNSPPALFLIGGSDGSCDFLLDKSNINVNFGDVIDGPGKSTQSNLLPAIIRTLAPTSFVPNRTFPILANATYNNYTVQSNGGSVVYTRYASTVNLPQGVNTPQGFRQNISASNENHKVNILTSLDPNTSQVTVAAIHVQDNSPSNLTGALININTLQWDLTDVNDNLIPQAFAFTSVTGNGNIPVDIMNDKASIIGTNIIIPQEFSEILLVLNKLKGKLKADIADQSAKVIINAKTSGANSLGSGVQSRRFDPIPLGVNPIILDPDLRGQQTLQIVQFNDPAGIIYQLNAFRRVQAQFKYRIQNDSINTVQVQPQNGFSFINGVNAAIFIGFGEIWRFVSVGGVPTNWKAIKEV